MYVYIGNVVKNQIRVPNSPCWFAYEDGHYVIDATFARATRFNSLQEAYRAVGYAKRETELEVAIVDVTLNVKIIPDADLRAERAIFNEILNGMPKSHIDILVKHILRDHGHE